MARVSGTKNITNNTNQTINSTGSVFVNAGTPTNPGEINLDSNGGTVFINQGGDVIINQGGGNVDINEGGGDVNINAGGGNLTLNDGGGNVDINAGGGNVKINEGGSGLLEVGSKTDFTNENNVGNLINNPTGANPPPDIDQTQFSTTAQRQVASAYFAGGVGIEQDLAVGGFIYGRIAQALTSTDIKVLATNTNVEFYPTFTEYLNTTSGVKLYGDPDDDELRYNPALGRLKVGKVEVTNTETSTSTDTGALKVAGGAAISKDITIGGVVYGFNDFTTQYLETIYDKYLGTAGPQSKIALAAGATDIFGEIQVRGKNPIGTGPVVTNVLYVTVDGNDTNDGRAQDPARACRTIGGALKSPYYQPGTQIRVSAGRYLENNPLLLKPYTSIMGSDIRTTFIEPINKTQDLFHLTSGCYLGFMTFLNGRSGKLKGDYAPGTNRGAYATAFPPQTGDNRIDLFHSPYVQNCTNQTGPWLNDGTMFQPSQTVQVPAVVGTGTWAANTTSIIVNAGTGTIAIGQYVNAGQQNPGFYDARTLLLANKPFLQSQVVAFVDATFNSGSFTYNQAKCERDTALILNAIGMDMLYNSTSDSEFSGLQYWNQGALEGVLPAEITATIAAIDYLSDISLAYVDPTLQTTVDTLYSTVTNILTNGTGGVTDWVVYGSLPSTAPATVSSYNALQSNKNAMQHAVIDWINTSYPSLVYNTTTCFRDVGYIIDSVSFDLLHGGNVQSIKSGVYYYSYSTTSTAIPNEIPQTTAAYNYIKSILPNIVTATPLPSTYQTSTSQVIVGNAGNAYDAEVLESKLDIITEIIRNGPAVVKELKPISLELNTATSLLNAYNLLIANTNFIKAEVIAYIGASMNNFQYNRQKCYRDVAILVENMSYDMAFGGNQKSVESGLSYYDGVVSVIAGQETQTISAIDYLSELCKQIVVNTTCTVLPVPAEIPSNSQVINTALVGGAIAIDPIEKLFNITTSIIEDGPSVAPAIYNSPGPDAAFVSAEILMQANREFIQECTLNYINHVLCQPPKTLAYNQIKCRRDAGVIIDTINSDMYFGEFSQSTFAGRQYYAIDGYTGSIKTEIQPTIRAVRYLRDMAVKVVKSITTATDAQAGITRYSTGTQFTSTNIASSDAVNTIELEFNIILNILGGHVDDWTDNVIPNGNVPSPLPGVGNAITLLQNNKIYLQQEVLAYIVATNPGFTFDQTTCERDIGYMIDAVTFDLNYGGNRMAVQSGLGYYDNVGTENVVEGEVTATIAAFNHLGTVAAALITGSSYTALQTVVKPVTGLSTGTLADVNRMLSALSTITNILQNGPGVAGAQYPAPITPLFGSTSTYNAFKILEANREFIAAETIAYLEITYNPDAFNYDQDLCYRDTGLIIDAVSQDILLGGNQKSLEAGKSYWNKGYNYVSGQITTTTAALNYARDISLQIIANQPVTPSTGTVAKQVINTFFEYGSNYMPQEAVIRNFGLITNIIENGPQVAPPQYAGGGLFALTGLNGSDVTAPPQVTRVEELSTGTFLVGLSTSTIGFGLNATLYFGDIYIFPLVDERVEELSLQYTGSTSTWNQRKVDTIGSMGGSLVDGNVISDRSPIESFVYDAFTQVTQGGIGVHITNNGYAQLVSVFTIFCSIGVLCDNGGIASITNSNCNFGDISIMSKGYGPRKFSGTVFNPAYRSYPFSPQGTDINGDPLPYLDQFYPTGYWPNLGRVNIFVPDEDDRPHIGLVMEVIPPDGHLNEQSFPGFLNAQPSTSTLFTGTIVLTNISTDDVSIGNTVFIRDQFGKQYDDFPYVHDADGNYLNSLGQRTNNPAEYIPNPNYLKWYAGTGTVVTDVNYNAITLNKALENGGGDPLNPTYFTLYFCGNSYYTVQTSGEANDPYVPYTNKLAANTNTNYQGPTVSQISAHVDALNYLKTCIGDVISNVAITPTAGTTATNTLTQVINTTVIGGADADTFIDLRMDYITSIVGAANYTAANAVVPPLSRTREGALAPGSGAAVTLIELNIDFLAAEIAAWVLNNRTSEITGSVVEQRAKCERDVKIILQALIYDLQTGGNYNSVFAGLSYWMVPGTYHVVTLGEAVRRPDLFPDGSTVNFYQRSYISASGYLFEYVGAGTNYGALPQRGVADPDQLKEVVQLNNGKVFFTSTDQNGDFRIGPGLVIAQATGVLTGRTFVQSLYANMTPFILAIE